MAKIGSRMRVRIIVRNRITERKRAAKIKKAANALGVAAFEFQSLAVTYVPAQLPAQYHRPGKA